MVRSRIATMSVSDGSQPGSGPSETPVVLRARFKVRLELEDLRCLLAGTTEWLTRDRFFVPSSDPIEPGHSCSFEIGLGRRGPWVEGEGEVIRAQRLPEPGGPTGSEIAIRMLSADSAELLEAVFSTWEAGGDHALQELIVRLAEAHEAEALTEAMPTAVAEAPADPADDTAPVLDAADPDEPVREHTLVLEDPHPPAAPAPPRRSGPFRAPVVLVLVSLAVAATAAGWWWTTRRPQPATSPPQLEAIPPAPAPNASERSPWVEVESIAWERSADGLEVRIATSAEISDRGYRHYRLEDGDRPRELLKLYGAAQTFPERFFQVEGGWISQIRTGSHFIDGVDELHIVFDLASPGVRLGEIRGEDRVLVIEFRDGEVSG